MITAKQTVHFLPNIVQNCQKIVLSKTITLSYVSGLRKSLRKDRKQTFRKYNCIYTNENSCIFHTTQFSLHKTFVSSASPDKNVNYSSLFLAQTNLISISVNCHLIVSNDVVIGRK